MAELLTAKSQGRFEATSCLLDTAAPWATNFYEVAFQRFDEIFSTWVVQDINVSCGRVLRLNRKSFKSQEKIFTPVTYSLILRIWMKWTLIFTGENILLRDP